MKKFHNAIQTCINDGPGDLADDVLGYVLSDPVILAEMDQDYEISLEVSTSILSDALTLIHRCKDDPSEQAATALTINRLALSMHIEDAWIGTIKGIIEDEIKEPWVQDAIGEYNRDKFKPCDISVFKQSREVH